MASVKTGATVRGLFLGFNVMGSLSRAGRKTVIYRSVASDTNRSAVFAADSDHPPPSTPQAHRNNEHMFIL
jgi:hypothetical protein